MTWSRLPAVAIAALVVATAVAASPARLHAEATPLEDLMIDFQVTPLEPQTPPPLSVLTLEDGRAVTLADRKGQVVLVYFFATW
jgi:cytochrome oxidase Cu insertion factor (SCO1/SenC/PrrC family)